MNSAQIFLFSVRQHFLKYRRPEEAGIKEKIDISSFRQIRDSSFGFMLSVTLLLFLSEHSLAASFDCTKANTQIEKMICADAHLSQLDGEYANKYEAHLEASSEKTNVKRTARIWLKEKRDECQTAECIRNAYEARIESLSDTATKSTEKDFLYEYRYLESNHDGAMQLKEVSLCEIKDTLGCSTATAYIVDINTVYRPQAHICDLRAVEQSSARISDQLNTTTSFTTGKGEDSVKFVLSFNPKTAIISKIENGANICGLNASFAGKWRSGTDN